MHRPELRPAAAQRFGFIGFAISAVRSQDVMAAVAKVPEVDWKPLRILTNHPPEAGGKPALVEVDSEGEAIAEVNFVWNEDVYSERERSLLQNCRTSSFFWRCFGELLTGQALLPVVSCSYEHNMTDRKESADVPA